MMLTVANKQYENKYQDVIRHCKRQSSIKSPTEQQTRIFGNLNDFFPFILAPICLYFRFVHIIVVSNSIFRDNYIGLGRNVQDGLSSRSVSIRCWHRRYYCTLQLYVNTVIQLYRNICIQLYQTLIISNSIYIKISN